jgi:hypothetical protein
MTGKRIIEMFNFQTGHSTLEPLRTESLETIKIGSFITLCKRPCERLASDDEHIALFEHGQ